MFEKIRIIDSFKMKCYYIYFIGSNAMEYLACHWANYASHLIAISGGATTVLLLLDLFTLGAFFIYFFFILLPCEWHSKIMNLI